MTQDTKPQPVPVSIKKHSDNEMAVSWNTGETTVIPFVDLRFECRCAGCVDEWTGARIIKREQVRADVRPTRVENVGRYAIQIDWSDGHRTGIYPYGLLYDIAKKEQVR